MHQDQIEHWRVSHDFLPDHRSGERRTRIVVALTVVMMVVEITAGWLYGSMALLADGWHMGSHAAALGITLFAYAYARRHANDPRYSFGTGKVGSLAAFASGMALGIVALLMAWESIGRAIAPEPIAFDEAIVVAAVGLAVNLVSAWLLAEEGGHGHEHEHARPHEHEHGGGHHHDHNLRAAFLHVAADALTSVLAIAALTTGKHLGWTWMDPCMGLVGAGVILHWTVGLLRQSSRVLLDHDAKPDVSRSIRQAIESDGDSRLADLHVWEIAPGRHAAILSIVAHERRSPDAYKARLTLRSLKHVTIEVNGCDDRPGLVPRRPDLVSHEHEAI